MNKRSMGKDSGKKKESEKREDFGSEEVTQLPDHVIAERCQNAAEEKSMHIRQRREDEEGEAEG